MVNISPGWFAIIRWQVHSFSRNPFEGNIIEPVISGSPTIALLKADPDFEIGIVVYSFHAAEIQKNQFRVTVFDS
jgi:hypothetical protein